MRTTLSIPLLFALTLIVSIGCQKKDKITTTDAVQTATAEAVEAGAAGSITEGTDESIGGEILDSKYDQYPDSLFMTYERTPCFGRCPIFKIRLYQSGYVTYEGINFVENMGFYEGRISNEQLGAIKAKLVEVGYADWQDSYDDKLISDLPSQKFLARTSTGMKKVVARYNVPEDVKSFGGYIEYQFKDTEWSPVTRDH